MNKAVLLIPIAGLLLAACANAPMGRSSDGSRIKDREQVNDAEDRTPLGAMAALERAIRAGDERRILHLTRAKTDAQRRALRAKAKGWAQIQAFSDAAHARFERDDVNAAFTGLGLRFPVRWITLEEAEVRMDGDRARIVDGPVHSQEMIREDGRWKAYFGNWNDEAAERAAPAYEALAKAMAQTTPEVREGRYRSAAEVSDVLTERAKAAGFVEE